MDNQQAWTRPLPSYRPEKQWQVPNNEIVWPQFNEELIEEGDAIIGILKK